METFKFCQKVLYFILYFILHRILILSLSGSSSLVRLGILVRSQRTPVFNQVPLCEIERTPFRNSSSKLAELQLYAAIPRNSLVTRAYRKSMDRIIFFFTNL